MTIQILKRILSKPQQKMKNNHKVMTNHHHQMIISLQKMKSNLQVHINRNLQNKAIVHHLTQTHRTVMPKVKVLHKINLQPHPKLLQPLIFLKQTTKLT
jgi:hypothetical protein